MTGGAPRLSRTSHARRNEAPSDRLVSTRFRTEGRAGLYSTSAASGNAQKCGPIPAAQKTRRGAATGRSSEAESVVRRQLSTVAAPGSSGPTSRQKRRRPFGHETRISGRNPLVFQQNTEVVFQNDLPLRRDDLSRRANGVGRHPCDQGSRTNGLGRRADDRRRSLGDLGRRLRDLSRRSDDLGRQAGDRFRSGRDPSRRTNYLITCRCLPMHRSAERRFGAGVALGFASCRMAFGAPRFMAGEQVRKEQGLSNKLDPVGRAFQPAGAGDFPAPSWFDGLKARRTSSLERLPYSTEIHGMPWAGLLTPLPQAPPTDA